MYYTSLPNHNQHGFDEQAHFNQFKQHNIIFNAHATKSNCENHIGCLSFKTVFNGEGWYGINNLQKAVRLGQFLMLNNNQNYSSRIDSEQKIKSVSIFFNNNFASTVFHNTLKNNESLLDNPFHLATTTLEFFQTLYTLNLPLQQQLLRLISDLDTNGYSSDLVDEHLIFLLSHLICVHKSESNHISKIEALKQSTQVEIYKRLCVAKDLLHSSFNEKIDLATISQTAYLSTPQLVRQFKATFQITPHQYLIKIRLNNATELLKKTDKSVQEITTACGFENTSAFCRSFKSSFGVSPTSYRSVL